MSSTHTIKFDEGGLGFVFDSTKIEFGPNIDDSAKLKKLGLQGDEALVCTGFEGKDCDRALFNKSTTLLGDATIELGKFVMNGVSSGISFDSSNFQNLLSEGTIRSKFTFPYSGAPTEYITLFSFFNTIGNGYNRSYLMHRKTTGDLLFGCYNDTTGEEINLGNFLPVSGTE